MERVEGTEQGRLQNDNYFTSDEETLPPFRSFRGSNHPSNPILTIPVYKYKDNMLFSSINAKMKRNHH